LAQCSLLLVISVLLVGCAVDDPERVYVSGTWNEIDTEGFTVAHATAWRYGDGPVTIAASPDATLIEALSANADPEADATWMAEALGTPLILHSADNNPAYPAGKTSLVGPRWMRTQSSDSTLDLTLSPTHARGRLVNDYIELDFNIPMRVIAPLTYAQSPWPQADNATWQAHYARLYASVAAGDRIEALRLIGAPLESARVLAADQRIDRMLARIHDYCPDPALLVDVPGYTGLITGLSRHGPHGVYLSEVWFHGGGDPEIPTFLNCSVTERDGANVDQCLAMQTDCAPAQLEVTGD